ncbi:MAG: hypothetical protein AAGJ51_09080 [Pseudomonadota bacterium]
MPKDAYKDAAGLPQSCGKGTDAGASVRLDEARYLPMIADFEISEEEKRELLQTLFTIMVTIVDLGLGLDPVQMLASESPDLIHSSSNPKTPFERAAEKTTSVEAPEES